MNIWKSTKVYTAFFLRATHFRKRTLKTDQVKLLGSQVLSCSLKITTANLRKIGLKMSE